MYAKTYLTAPVKRVKLLRVLNYVLKKETYLAVNYFITLLSLFEPRVKLLQKAISTIRPVRNLKQICPWTMDFNFMSLLTFSWVQNFLTCSWRGCWEIITMGILNNSNLLGEHGVTLAKKTPWCVLCENTITKRKAHTHPYHFLSFLHHTSICAIFLQINYLAWIKCSMKNN